MQEETDPCAPDLFLDEEAVLQLRWPRKAYITEAQAVAAMRRVDQLCGRDRHPMLVDMATTEKVSPGARAVFGLPCQASRIALLGSSQVDKVIANFALGLGRRPCPTRFFTSREEAMTWLKAGRE